MCGQWPAVGSTPVWFSKNEANYGGRAPTRVSPTPAPCPPYGPRILTEAMQRGESRAKGWCSHHTQKSPAIIPSVYGHWLRTSQGSQLRLRQGVSSTRGWESHTHNPESGQSSDSALRVPRTAALWTQAVLDPWCRQLMAEDQSLPAGPARSVALTLKKPAWPGSERWI